MPPFQLVYFPGKSHYAGPGHDTPVDTRRIRRSKDDFRTQRLPYGVQVGSVQTDPRRPAFHRFSHMNRALHEPLGHVRVAKHRESCHAAIHADEQDTRPVMGQFITGAGDVLHDLQRRMFCGLL